MGIWGSKQKENVDGKNDNRVAKQKARTTTVVSFVYTATSALFEDEDGDQADEFYVEYRRNRVSSPEQPRWTFRKTKTNLQPVGEVELECPRIHRDCPIVLMQYTPTKKLLQT